MKTFGYIVLIVAFAAVNATSCVDRGYQEPTSCECPNYLASNLEWIADNEAVSPGPGARGAGNGCGASYLPAPSFGGQTRTFTTTLPAGGRTGSVLQVQYDNNLISCSLNGRIIPGSQNLVSGHCCHVNDCSAIEIPDHYWEITNTLSCTVQDQGGLAFFDAAVCGDVVGPLNPLEPECRQKFLNEEDGLLHLINRNDEGDMGCISDDECTDNTSHDSWCKSDGTCRGCDDWEGCCVIQGAETAVPRQSCFGNFEEDAGSLNWICTALTNCEESYCMEDGTCFPCEAAEGDVDIGSANEIVFPSSRSVGALVEIADEVCRTARQCPEAKAQLQEIVYDEISQSYSFGGSEQVAICDDPCRNTKPGYTPVPVSECLIGDDVFCREFTACSASFCKESGESAGGYGLCHLCDLDDYPSEENPVPTCTGINDIEHEACKVATGCSHSYCKGDVCQLCEDDGYTGADV